MARYDGCAWVPLSVYLGKHVEGPWCGFVGDEVVEFVLELSGEGFDDILKFLCEL